MAELDGLHQLLPQEGLLHEGVGCLFRLGQLALDHPGLVLPVEGGCRLHPFVLTLCYILVSIVISGVWGVEFVLEGHGLRAFVLNHPAGGLVFVIRLHKFSVDEESLHQLFCAVELLPLTVLPIQLPVAAVEASVLPVHLAVATSHVVLIVALVEVATSPRIYSVPVFFIVLELALVLVAAAGSSLPQAVATPQAIAEVAFVVLAVRPIKLAESIEFSLAVLAFVEVSVVEMLHALTIFDEIDKAALITTALRFSKHSEAIGLAFSPLSYVRVSFVVPPHACAVL